MKDLHVKFEYRGEGFPQIVTSVHSSELKDFSLPSSDYKVLSLCELQALDKDTKTRTTYVNGTGWVQSEMLYKKLRSL